LTLDTGERVFRNVNAIENAPPCQSCHDPQPKMLGVLISDFDMAQVDRNLARDRWTSVLWSIGSIAVILLAVNYLMDRLVIGRLVKFLPVIDSLTDGNLDARIGAEGDDEIGELARAFDHMADGLKEKARLEQDLRAQAQRLEDQTARLSALNAIASTVSQSLNLSEILDSALDKALELTHLKAGWVLLRDEQTETSELVAVRGLPEHVVRDHVACAWNQCVCADIIDSGQPRILHEIESRCPMSEYFCQKSLSFRVCNPLTSKDRVLGVMSLAGSHSRNVQALVEDAPDLLTAIGRQIGIAVENARLYEELRQEERIRRWLLERIMTVQEKERRRISLELHDQTGQPLTSLIMHLGALAEARSLDEVKAQLHYLRDTAAQVLQEVHDLALELRPTILDDLGLLAALRHLRKESETRFRLSVDLQVLGLDDRRLPSAIETSLYRIVQEALTNVARHAKAQSVSVLLESREDTIALIVEDDGRGFDVSQVMDSRLNRDRLGLYGMRERVSLLGGTLTIESTPQVGTAIYVEIPLDAGAHKHVQDPPSRSR